MPKGIPHVRDGELLIANTILRQAILTIGGVEISGNPPMNLQEILRGEAGRLARLPSESERETEIFYLVRDVQNLLFHAHALAREVVRLDRDLKRVHEPPHSQSDVGRN